MKFIDAGWHLKHFWQQPGDNIPALGAVLVSQIRRGGTPAETTDRSPRILQTFGLFNGSLGRPVTTPLVGFFPLLPLEMASLAAMGTVETNFVLSTGANALLECLTRPRSVHHRSASLIARWADGGAGGLPSFVRVPGSLTKKGNYRDRDVLHRPIGGSTLWGQDRVRNHSISSGWPRRT